MSVFFIDFISKTDEMTYLSAKCEIHIKTIETGPQEKSQLTILQLSYAMKISYTLVNYKR